MGSMLGAYNQPGGAPRIPGQATLDVVEVYPYVPYVQYLLPGSICMSIFMMVMIGGGIIFIDDKARGLHEGYLVTPITKFELIAGFNLSGTIKAVLAGFVLMTIGSLIAGIPNPFDPMRLFRLFVVIVVTAFALISLMFLLMVRVTDPLMPRAMFGVLNTLLYFPSGAVYPQQGFPGLDAGDRRRRSVHLRGARVQEPAAQEHRLRGDRRRSRLPADLLGRLDDRRHAAVPPHAMSGRDLETRERLLRTAARLFADRGFKRVTVRDICRTARANVAAVNYHFGDKLGLYREVLQVAIDALRSTTEAARAAGEGCAADEKLRRFVRVHLGRILAVDRDDWIHRLINREIADPTPALDALVDQGMRPRIEYLSGVVAELLGCPLEDPRVMRSVASIQSQSVAYLPNPLAARLGLKSKLTPAEIDEVAQHIAEFSLAGIRAIAD